MRLSMRNRYGTSFAAVEWLVRTFAGVLLSLSLATSLPLAGARAANATPVKVVVLGDSLSAGLGLPEADAFPAQLQKSLDNNGVSAIISNAGVSGDTASGGLDRLDWSVPEGTQAVILELGANDALRGTDPNVTRAALDAIIKQLKVRNIAVLLCGMLAPPNYGADFAARFNAIYPDLAKAYDVPLYPFFLDGVAADTRLNQADGMHPTSEGVAIIVKRILPAVEALLRPIAGQGG